MVLEFASIKYWHFHFDWNWNWHFRWVSTTLDL